MFRILRSSGVKNFGQALEILDKLEMKKVGP